MNELLLGYVISKARGGCKEAQYTLKMLNISWEEDEDGAEEEEDDCDWCGESEDDCLHC